MQVGMLTAEQLRAARALLHLEQRRLAEISGVSIPTLRRLEGSEGPLRANHENIVRLTNALQAAGVVFIAAGGGRGVGVQLATDLLKAAQV